MTKNRIASYLVTFFLFIPVISVAQEGVIKEGLALDSNILSKEFKYSIYLPAGYDESVRNYPVLYLLHGYSPAKNDYVTWVQFGEIKKIADKEMQTLETTDMIIVMPDFGESWYVNSYNEGMMYEDFFFDEFIPFIDETYQTRPEKQYRAVAGLSMGGYGTLLFSLKHPDIFAAAAPLSAGIFTDEEVINMPQKNWDRTFGPVFKSGLQGEQRLTDHYLENSILNIVQTEDAEKLSSVQFYIDCGDDDFLIKGNMALHTAMIDKKIPHEFRVRDGSHNWTYWRTALPEVLKFVSKSFHRY